MRTTLTLDPDVAAMLKKAVAKKSDASFKAIVNEALRKGLSLPDSNQPKKVFKQQTWDYGGPMPSPAEMKDMLLQEDLDRFDEVTRRQRSALRDKP